MSDSVRPHRRQPTRLPRLWDCPGKNPGVGCHFLLQCMNVESERDVAQSCPTLSDPMDCSLPGSSTHGIFQARVLEWGALPSPVTQHWIAVILQLKKGLFILFKSGSGLKRVCPCVWCVVFTDFICFVPVMALPTVLCHPLPMWLPLDGIVSQYVTADQFL